MSDAQFIVDYVSNCIANNKNPINVAQNELQEIDRKVKEADALSLKKKSLLAVLDYCGYKTLGKNKDKNNFVEFEDDSEPSVEMQNKITTALKEKGPLTVRSIINAVGSYEEDYFIIKTIKLLGSKNIINRNDKTLCYELINQS